MGEALEVVNVEEEMNDDRDRAGKRMDSRGSFGGGAAPRIGGNFGRILDALGVTAVEWLLEQSTVDIDAKGWLEKRLRAAGWVRKEEADKMVTDALNRRQPSFPWFTLGAS